MEPQQHADKMEQGAKQGEGGSSGNKVFRDRAVPAHPAAAGVGPDLAHAAPRHLLDRKTCTAHYDLTERNRLARTRQTVARSAGTVAAGVDKAKADVSDSGHDGGTAPSATNSIQDAARRGAGR